MPKFFIWIILFILFILDIYTFQAVKTLTKSRWVHIAYFAINLLLLTSLILLILFTDRSVKSTYYVQWILGIILIFYLPKLFISIVLLLEDIVRLFSWGFQKISATTSHYPSRRKAITLLGLGIGAIPFIGFLYGTFIGRFQFTVKKLTLNFPDLPESFHGFKIVQLSDIHIGSFTLGQMDELMKATKIINEQNADLLLFTGDMVNFIAEEAYEFKDFFSKINPGKYGKYSILGNHDYGEYEYRDNPKKCEENRNKLQQFQKTVGFTMLRNEHVKIIIGNENINLIGVENWGASFHFPKSGDLNKASQGIESGEFNVLMSHDPTHFDFDPKQLQGKYSHLNNIHEIPVKDFPKKIHLMLSGHTHGAQFGVEISQFLKWSPVEYVYKKWAGLYEENGRKLYINRGFGFLAMPSRLGIWPEITVIELRKS